MSTRFSTEDTLPHVEYSGDVIDANDPSLLRNNVSATDGQIVIVSAFGCSLVLNWSFNAQGLSVTVVLQTPVGSITIVNAELNPSNPTITLGGSIDSFKAEVTVTFDFNAMTLTATGEVCAPFLGCKQGSITINV